MARYYPPLSPMQTGFAGKCPRCGQGRLFASFLKLAPRCEQCGLDYAKADAGDGPAVFMIFIAGFVAVAVLFVTGFVLDWPAGIALLLAVVSLVGLIGLLMQPLKGLMVAQQYAAKAREGSLDGSDDDADWL